nr:filamentous hemagglutinin N-terminal domain-containing protein [uncultured Pseudodesulfovibrio sp.]
MKANRISNQLLSVILSCLIVFQPGFIAMAGDRPTVVDPTASDGKKPIIDQAANGVPIELIATPGSGGVSHNLFTDFNVNKIGLIINNSQSMGQSQLGGIIAGNPNLKGGEARLILNEVTGANRSHLEGYTELHGGKADYILANPNGITVNGGGFINFPQVTLTTGKSCFGTGGLEGIDVRSGEILVEGAGVNATNIDAFTLLARATQINAAIHAKILTIAVGQNAYNPTDGSITALAPDATLTPSVVIDSSALGGMYARRIVLQGTEAGVGVNLKGIIQTVDSFELTADGQIRLKNKTTAGTDIQIRSQNGGVEINDTVYAGGAALVSAADALNIRQGASGDTAMVGAAGHLTLSAASVNAVDGNITAGLQTDGSVSGGTLSVMAANSLTTKDSKLVSGGKLSIASSDISIDGGSVAAVDKLSIQGSNSGDVVMTGAAELSSLNAMDVEARSWTAADGLLKANGLYFSLIGDLNLGSAVLNSTGTLTLEANSLATGAGASITSFADMVLALDALQNNGGLIYAGDELNLNVRRLDNTSAGYIVGVNGVDVSGQTEGSRAALIRNNQSVIESLGGSVNIAAESLENISGAATITTQDAGWIYWSMGFPSDFSGFKADGTRNVFSEAGARLYQNKGGVNAHLQYILETYGLPWHRPYDGRTLQEWIHTTEEIIDNAGMTAEILSAKNMVIDADTILNHHGIISSGDDLTITANSLTNRGVELSRHLDFYRNFHQVHDSGRNSYGQVQQHFELSQVTSSDPAVVAAVGTLTVNVPGHVKNESFKEGEQYTGKFAGNAAYSDLEVTGPLKDPNTGEPVNTVTVSLPTGVGSLYVVNKDPKQTYLIETNPAMTNVGNFYGSQYFFDEVGVNVADLNNQILGDAFFETNMVRKQILKATGKRYLNPTYTSDADQFRRLMDNAAQAKTELGLEIGVALSAEQLAGLTEDIVWYETREVMGKKVLVPVVYLGSVSQANLDLTRGAMLTGDSVNIKTAELDNSGGIVGQNVTVEADNVRNSGGDLAGQTLNVTAGKDIINSSGSIRGKDVSLSAGRNVAIETKTEQRRDGATDSHAYVHQTADVTAGGDLNITSGGDTSIRAAGLSAGGAVNITSTGDVAIGTKAMAEHLEARDYKADQTGNMGSSVQAEDLDVLSGGNVSVVGSSLVATNGASIDAVGNVAVTGVINTTQSNYEHSSSGGIFGGGGSSKEHLERTRVTESSVSAGGNVNINAGTKVEDAETGNLVLLGSRINAGGNANLTAEGDIITGAMKERTYQNKSGSSSGLFSSSTSKETTDETGLVRSIVEAGQDARLTAGGSVALDASVVKADQNVKVTATTGDVLISSGQETSYHHAEESKSGFMGIGSMELNEKNSVSTVRGEIEGGGKVVLNAKGDITLQAASITSGDTTEITSTEGLVSMLVAKDSKYEREIKSDSGFLLWSSSEKGEINETVLHTLIDAGGGLTITTAEGVVVELKDSTGDVRKDAELLSNVEGLEWMGGLLERDDVDWQAVQEIHDQWSKSDSGLGMGAMLIISIVAAAVTAGAASELALAAMNLTTLEGATAMEMAVHAALQAGFVSLSAQVTTSVADAAAGGDLGNNLKNIVSADGLRSLMASMLLAGTMTTYASDFAKKGPLGEVIAKTTVKTLTSTIVGGEDLEESFMTALGSTFASYAKGKITSAQLNDTVNLILTGATGAAGSAIVGGDPVQGALSAIVAELAEQIKAPKLTAKQKAEVKPYAIVSNAVYSEGGELPENFERVDLDEKGISPQVMKNKDGLQSELYRNNDTGEYILAFSGTNEALDWNTNIAQAGGNVGAQYESLTLQLGEIRGVLGQDATIIATGHSLGGGIATAAASTGLVNKAVVFNPAGVHERTLVELNPKNTAKALSRANKTTAYVSRGDLLTNFQDMLSFMMPTTVGKRVVVEGGGIHFMDDMVEVFNE